MVSKSDRAKHGAQTDREKRLSKMSSAQLGNMSARDSSFDLEELARLEGLAGTLNNYDPEVTAAGASRFLLMKHTASLGEQERRQIAQREEKRKQENRQFLERQRAQASEIHGARRHAAELIEQHRQQNLMNGREMKVELAKMHEVSGWRGWNPAMLPARCGRPAGLAARGRNPGDRLGSFEVGLACGWRAAG